MSTVLFAFYQSLNLYIRGTLIYYKPSILYKVYNLLYNNVPYKLLFYSVRESDKVKTRCLEGVKINGTSPVYCLIMKFNFYNTVPVNKSSHCPLSNSVNGIPATKA